jgi:hypothetical protein
MRKEIAIVTSKIPWHTVTAVPQMRSDVEIQRAIRVVTISRVEYLYDYTRARRRWKFSALGSKELLNLCVIQWQSRNGGQDHIGLANLQF